jgi:ADP-ribose pyrophosphatase YjhB (NUDIX family)
MPEQGSRRPVDAPSWLAWARALQSIAQAGLTYSRDEYDLERFRDVRRIGAEIAAAATGEEPRGIEDFFASASGYPTPKIDVRAAVIVEGRILLVRERDDGCWSMPGGWADIGESAAESAVRETREEAGMQVRAMKLIALYERERHGHPVHPEFSYKAFFACEPAAPTSPTSGPANLPGSGGHEIVGVGFFARDATVVGAGDAGRGAARVRALSQSTAADGVRLSSVPTWPRPEGGARPDQPDEIGASAHASLDRDPRRRRPYLRTRIAGLDPRATLHRRAVAQNRPDRAGEV